jgi:hypothetical protein
MTDWKQKVLEEEPKLGLNSCFVSKIVVLYLGDKHEAYTDFSSQMDLPFNPLASYILLLFV